jgi:hypothetical protein
MNRTELKQLVEDCGHDQDRIKERLEQYFETDEGKAVLDQAPRCMVYTGTSAGDPEDGLPGEKVAGQQTTRDLVVSLLMQEVEEWLNQHQKQP